MSKIISWVPEAIRFAQDPESGARIEQLTSDAVTSTNIYGEQRYTSADGSRIALNRKPFGQPNQIWVCDLNKMRVAYAGTGVVLGANAPKNALYFRSEEDGNPALSRLDFTDLSIRTMFSFDPKVKLTVGAVSPDEKHLLAGPIKEEEGDAMYSMMLYDLATGESRKICTIQDMRNPHAQFDPGDPTRSILQINRAAHRKIQGVEEGEPGASLVVLDITTGEIFPLPAGRPMTPSITGHECWQGTTGVVLYTAGQYDVSHTSYVTYKANPPALERHLPMGAIYAARAGDKTHRIVAQGKLWNHLACSDDGRYFIGDDHVTGRVHIGSVATGKYVGLCESHTRQGVCQHSHVHPYMTPDNAWVIFNSIVTGVAQVYAARIPEGFLDQLD